MLKNKINHLRNILLKHKKVLIAFSGGVDSTFLLYVAVQTLKKSNVLAVTALSETYPAMELKLAKSFCKKLKVKHIILQTKELENIKFNKNPFNRCFYCKDELFRKLKNLAKKNKMILCDATNSSDSADYRPGRRAAKKWKVSSPLLDSGLEKQDIRILSRQMKLPTWNMPAQACLASRIPYKTEITEELLKRIEKAENYLKTLGFVNVRVRHHDKIARIEVDPDKIVRLTKFSKEIASKLRKLGWNYITIDIEGYRTGSLNIFE